MNPRNLIIAIIIVSLFFISIYFILFSRKSGEQKDITLVDEIDLVFGNLDSKKFLIEYASLQCPACAYFHLYLFDNIKEAIRNNKTGYVIRLIPLSNDEVGNLLVKIGYCSLKTTKSIEAIEKIYQKLEYSRDISSLYDLFPDYKTEIEECVKSQEAEMYLKNSLKRFFESGFSGVPSFLVFSEGKISRVEGARRIELE